MRSVTPSPKDRTGSPSSGGAPVPSVPWIRALAWCALCVCLLLVIAGPAFSVFMLTETGREIVDRLREPLPDSLRRRAFVLLAVVMLLGPPLAGFQGSLLVRRWLYDPFSAPGICRRCGHDCRHARAPRCPECGANR